MRVPQDTRRRTSASARALRALGFAGALVFAGATCDAPTALTAPGVRNVAMAWDGDTVLLAGTASVPKVAVTIDGEPYPFARLAVASSDPSVLSVGPDGSLLEARRLGRATLTIRLLSTAIPSAPTLSVNVVVGPKRVTLSIGADTLYSLGDTTVLTAMALDADDQALTQIPVQWTTSDTAVVTIDARGVAKARANGSVELRGEVGGQVATVPLVVHQRAARLVMSHTSTVLDAIGAEITFTATPVDGRGAPLALAEPVVVNWESSAPSIATSNGARVTAVDNGIAWVHAITAEARDSVKVTVAQRAERVVIETPSPLAMRSVGETVQLKARGYDRRGFEVRTGLPMWRSLQQLVVHVETVTGRATAIAAGPPALLLAEMDAASDTIEVQVADVPDRVRLEPASDTITSVGDTLQLRWTVSNARGVAIPDAPVAFRSFDESIVRVLPNGAAIAVGIGSARVVATSGTVADTSLLTVVNAVAHVDIAPTIVLLASVGDTVIPEVTVRNARGDALDRSAAAWRSQNDAVARVVAGVIVARDAGETVIYASSPTYGDRRDSLLIVVTNAPASIELPVDRDAFSALGVTRAYTADVRNARGALIPGYVPTWRSDTASIVRVSANGIATAMGAGTARVIATAGSVADTIVITVKDSVTSLEVLPSSAVLPSVNDTVRATVTARNELGSAVRDPALGWFSTDTLVARVAGNGLIIATGAGSARVIVTAGIIADTVAVTVTNVPVLVDIAVRADTLMSLGDSVTLAVTVRNARGDYLSPTTLVWSSDDPVVARVNASGTVTARDTGTTWIRAVGGAARDSMLMVVTNDAASVVVGLAPDGVSAYVDTLNAAGQSLSYVAAVRNAQGRVIEDFPVAWRSTDATVASVSGGGTVVATGFGAAWVIARAGSVEDSVRIVVVDPRRLYVDNSVVTPVRFGTRARPYATIQDAVNAAGVDDTVIVNRGYGYSESVTLGRRVTLLGDSTDFVAGGRDAQLLPRVNHDLGVAGIVAVTPGASYTIGYLGIQHSVDGEAILVRDADNVLVKHVHVNPVPSFRTGRGIGIESATGSAIVLRSTVDSVYGFGVRVRGTANARIDQVTVRGVGARPGYAGAGIELAGGTAGVVTDASVRRTAGPQVLLAGTTDASLLNSVLAGEQQLARITGALGATTVRGNSFDMRRQAGDAAPIRGGGLTDPSGLEISGSAGVLVADNGFTDIDGATSLMDAVRLSDVRVGASGASYGALLSSLRFRGGRTGVRSERSSWRMTGSRADSAGTAVLLGAADSVVLATDTVMNARAVGVQAAGAATRLEVTTSQFGGAQRAIVATGVASVLVRGSAVAGVATGGPVAQPTLGALDIDAAGIEVAGNTIRGVRSFAALVVRGGAGRVDSNMVTRNLLGIRTAGVPVAMTHNALFDNDSLATTRGRSARALVNDGAPVTVGANWWGDAAGPQVAGKVAGSVGDSIVGSVAYDSIAAPIAAHAGTGSAALMHMLRGDGQVGVFAAPAPVPMSLRVVDAQGRPLAGVSVTFRASGGDIVGGTRISGSSQRIVVSNTSGVAEVSYLFDTKRGTSTITATATGAPNLVFTAVVP